MSLRNRVVSLVAVVAIASTPAFAALSKSHTAWGKGPAQHLMTPEEKEAWSKLKTDAEAQAFVDLFWARRDPTPATPVNEAKQQFEAAVEYADKNFTAGRVAGSMSDRGRVLILVGAPTSVRGSGQPKTNIQQGALQNTQTGEMRDYAVPTQTWIYERERVPSFAKTRGSLEIPFVDQNSTNTWKLGSSPQTNVNDLLKSAVTARIVSPALTAAPKFDTPKQVAQVSVPAPQVTPSTTTTTTTTITTFRTPSYQTAVDEFRAAKSNPYKGLSLSYGEFVTSSGEYYVPIQLYVPGSAALPADKPLTFFGVVEDASGKIVAVYEEPATLTASRSDFFYDKTLVLPSGKYKATFGLAADGKPLTMNSMPMELSSIDKSVAGTSKLILSNNVFPLTAAQLPTDPFAFGGIKVVPKGDRTFTKADELWYFLEVRNAGVENGQPNMTLKLDIEGTTKGGKKIKRGSPLGPAPAQELKGVTGHWGIGSAIPLTSFEPGDYTLKLTVNDTIGKQTWSFSEPFKVVGN
jgi:GWxTD domain-containing protein